MSCSTVQRVESGYAARNRRAAGAIAALLVGCASLCGCNWDEAARAFRSGSADELRSGLESIAGGLIDGLLTAVETGADASGSTNTAGTTATADAASTDSTTTP